MIWSMIRSWSHPRSDPVRSGPIEDLSTPDDCRDWPHSGEQLNMAASCERNGSGQSLEDLLGNEGTTAALVFNAIMTAAAQPLTCARLQAQVMDCKRQMTQWYFTLILYRRPKFNLMFAWPPTVILTRIFWYKSSILPFFPHQCLNIHERERMHWANRCSLNLRLD